MPNKNAKAAPCQPAFDADRVTRRFFDCFRKRHADFSQEVRGLGFESDRQRYTTLTLNRLMFVYFIQKKGFLDGDTDYLRNRLARVRRAGGKDRFHSFYRCFLLRLFHDGLGKPPEGRGFDAETEKLIGKVPYLNGGFFEPHALEAAHPDIDIPDKAFERLFGFFEEWTWHLDDRPLRRDNEINPDVVGYIFEKYINQKQMGAYYTKEDITGYIAANTIVPRLFDMTERKCAAAFEPGSALWRPLAENPDRYLYPAVRQGVVDRDGEPVPLPPEIEAGIGDVSKRGGWNALAPRPWGLPAETWREHVARRRRCLEIREKLRRGEVHRANDLVTLNLDLRQFAGDAITGAEGPELLRAFWHAVQKVTVLDPTCGSGAFLFAALGVLEALYGDCLARMEAFVGELGEGDHPKAFSDFREALANAARHPSERYFILKSIVVNSLFGVDLMDEAVEICKLRLFLKLAAQVEAADQMEPLPDIDFNIRAGNTLVGFASLEQAVASKKGKLFGEREVRRIQEEAETIGRVYGVFQRGQDDPSAAVSRGTKDELRRRLSNLGGELDRYLAEQYDPSNRKEARFRAWRESHRPFHWFAEFYVIMAAGGFDVIIGNPPYVASGKAKKDYTVKGYLTEGCPDIYAWCLERVSQLANRQARTGMITPLSLGFSGDMAPLRSLLYSSYKSNWFSSFGIRPSALFSGISVRNTIHIGSRNGDGSNYTTRLHRWWSHERDRLFSLIAYSPYRHAKWSGRIPKLNTDSLIAAFESLVDLGKPLGHELVKKSAKHILHYRKTAGYYLCFCKKTPPCYDKRGRQVEHTEVGEIFVPSLSMRDIFLALLNGKISFVFWLAIGDDFHVTRGMIENLPVDLNKLKATDMEELSGLSKELDSEMKKAMSFITYAGKKTGSYNLAKCRHVTDKTDHIFARAFGLADVWEDMELLYAQCVRADYGTDADASDAEE